MSKFVKTAAKQIVDGQYLVEFTAGERVGVVTYIELIAEVLNGPARGMQVGESMHFSFGPDATGQGNRKRVEAYGVALGVTSNQADHEEWLFRPFTASVQAGRIVTIRGETGDTIYLPAAGRRSRRRVWTEHFGWVWQWQAPLENRRARIAA